MEVLQANLIALHPLQVEVVVVDLLPPEEVQVEILLLVALEVMVLL
tara:strand:- start:281 stop:418 length:138 start_codon:yes stop_codon:yes gene_type:complete